MAALLVPPFIICVSRRRRRQSSVVFGVTRKMLIQSDVIEIQAI